MDIARGQRLGACCTVAAGKLHGSMPGSVAETPLYTGLRGWQCCGWQWWSAGGGGKLAAFPEGASSTLWLLHADMAWAYVVEHYRLPLQLLSGAWTVL
jgi:hypothetical protein